ncbi:tannase/feruloyl esterase family alpha/beta hydrolase [Thermodesulfobacteriota bacterium]
MKIFRLSLSFLIFVSMIGIAQPLTARESCEDLALEKLSGVTITSAVFMDDPEGFTLPQTPGMFGTSSGLKTTAQFCRVTGFIEPVKGSHIRFEVWMPPADKWNNRYFGVGNPAFEGAIKYQGLQKAVEEGYATASTDTGHQHPGHEWATGHPERLVDWVHRSVHETTVAAKSIIKAYYGKPQKYAYWDNCHNGGRQGLTAAQRYPDDFDGIVAGDPAYHLTHLQTGSEYLSWVNLKDGVDSPSYLPTAKTAALHRAVMDACDTLDGVKDNAIEDPTRCKFDPAVIQCKGEENDSCLTPAQAKTARAIYAGAKFNDGTQIYSGFEPGSELLWEAMIKGPEPLFINNGFFQYIAFEDPDWDFRTFDIDADTRDIDKRLGPIINNIQTDLTEFKKSGGKLILYQAWNETWVPPRTAVKYYEDVVKNMDGYEETKDFFRLFMVPDFGMCPSMFPGTFDALGAVRKWVEEGVAPDQITTTYFDQSGQFRERAGMQDAGIEGASESAQGIIKTRPVCAYPEVAIYKGKGDINKAENYRCGKPTW